MADRHVLEHFPWPSSKDACCETHKSTLLLLLLFNTTRARAQKSTLLLFNTTRAQSFPYKMYRDGASFLVSVCILQCPWIRFHRSRVGSP